jgi:hypothetical protein
VQFAAKPADFGLLAQAQQGPQSEFNRLALGLEAGCPESRPEREAANRK